MYLWAKEARSLGVDQWRAGSTPGLLLDQEAIEGIKIAIQAKGPDTPSLAETLAALRRIVLSVAGTDYVNISGYSLYQLNRSELGGSEPWSVTPENSATRHLNLFLPFSLEGGIHSSDTLLDLRRGDSLVQAFIRYDLGDAGGQVSLAGSQITSWQHYYLLGDHTRKIGYMRQLRERTESADANQKITFNLDYGSDFDDLNRILLFGVNAAGGFINTPVKEITLTVSESGTREIFHFNDPVANYDLHKTFEPRTQAVSSFDSQVFDYVFPKGNLKGAGRTLRGFLDGRSASNITLEITAALEGTYYLLLDRVNLRQPDVDAA